MRDKQETGKKERQERQEKSMTDTDTCDAYICREENSPIQKIVIKSQIQPMRMDTGIS